MCAIILSILLVSFAGLIKASAIAPLAHAIAPVALAIAPVAYHHAIPFNHPPYSDRVDVFSKVLNFPVTGAFVAAAPVLHAAPIAAAPVVHAAPIAAAPVGVLPPHVHHVEPFVYPHHHHHHQHFAHVLPSAPVALAPHLHALPHAHFAAPVWRR